MFKVKLIIFSMIMFFCSNPGALASGTLLVNIFIKDHIFYPSAILVPKEHKIKLIIHNQDKSIEEFDSTDLNREKIILGNSIVHIVLASLTPGKYCFIGEFHPDSANGCLYIY